MFVKVRLPNMRIIRRAVKARPLGNFVMLSVRYKNEEYLIGDGDEYMRGVPGFFVLDFKRMITRRPKKC